LPRLHSNLRLTGFDYAQPGAYYVTLVTRGRELLFEDARYRELATECWQWLGEHLTHVVVDEYVVMPNHLHGLLILNGVDALGAVDPCRRPSRGAPTVEQTAEPTAKAKPLGQIIGAFKTVSTARINMLRGTPGAQIWQRNFHDRVVHSNAELDRIRKYIHDNPAMWEQDPENPGRAGVEEVTRFPDRSPL